MMVVVRVARHVHEARVPVALARHRLRPPMRPDAELGIAEPVGRLVGRQRLDRRLETLPLVEGPCHQAPCRPANQRWSDSLPRWRKVPRPSSRQPIALAQRAPLRTPSPTQAGRRSTRLDISICKQALHKTRGASILLSRCRIAQRLSGLRFARQHIFIHANIGGDHAEATSGSNADCRRSR